MESGLAGVSIEFGLKGQNDSSGYREVLNWPVSELARVDYIK